MFSQVILFIPGVERVLEHLVLRQFGLVPFLLLLLLWALLYAQHLQNCRKEGNERERSLKEEANVAEARARVLEDQVRLAAIEVRVAQQQKALAEQKASAREELLQFVRDRRSIMRFPSLRCNNFVHKRRVLLVEDELLLHIWKDVIEESLPETEVTVVTNGTEALAEIRKYRPDLVITDLFMPSLDGYELIDILSRKFPEIPVLAVSNHAQNKAEVAAKVGSLPPRFEFVSKPLPLEELLEAVRRMMRPSKNVDVMPQDLETLAQLSY
jgi:CheY-like chemotaxis protein